MGTKNSVIYIPKGIFVNKFLKKKCLHIRFVYKQGCIDISCIYVTDNTNIKYEKININSFRNKNSFDKILVI